jgi:RNA polymerase sigma factor (TIGR02999 family)
MEITELLHRARSGEEDALQALTPLVYNELRRIATAQLRREQHATVQATALVHEAYLRLVGSPLPEFQSRSHFYGIAGRLMRQVLVDFARTRTAAKRGPGLVVPLADLGELGSPPDEAFLALNEALERLAQEHPRKAQLVELRFFVGLTAEEAASVVGIPVHTARRELRLAQAWLRRELSEAE